MYKCLMNAKKRAGKAKERRGLDKNESNPIPFSSYNYSCKWPAEESNIISWVWTATQLNFVARPVSIESLSSHSLIPYED